MRKFVIAGMFVLLLFAMGCAKQPVDEGTTPETPTEIEVEVTEPQAPVEEAKVEAGGEVISDIVCNRETRTLTFTISNIDSEDWYLERVSAFDVGKKTAAKLSVTGKLVNDLDVICDMAILPAGDEVTCTKVYDEALFARAIRLTNGDQLGTLDYNTMRFQTLEVNEVIQFDC